jgi:hypothetical protein
MAALQKQIGTLVGKNSGYFETLPKDVQERIKALKNLHVRIVAWILLISPLGKESRLGKEV